MHYGEGITQKAYTMHSLPQVIGRRYWQSTYSKTYLLPRSRGKAIAGIILMFNKLGFGAHVYVGLSRMPTMPACQEHSIVRASRSNKLRVGFPKARLGKHARRRLWKKNCSPLLTSSSTGSAFLGDKAWSTSQLTRLRGNLSCQSQCR